MKELSTPNILRTIWVQRDILATTKKKEQEERARRLVEQAKAELKRRGN